MIDAYAAATTAHPQQGGFGSILIMAVLFGLFYFLLVRPQSKRVKEHRDMVSQLSVGDEVVTGGGIVGAITKVAESFVTLEIAQGVQVNVQKGSVNNVLPKGTIDSIR